MNFLEERILKDGVVKAGNVLKVDSFLNHQMDVALIEEIGREFKRRFGHKTVTKVLTIEASGIGIAAFVAKEFGVPMVFAKKSKSVNIDGEMFVAEVESFTHKNRNQVIVSKRFLHEGEHLLIIDDFLDNGCALQGLISIAESAGCIVEGCGIVIEKEHYNNRNRLLDRFFGNAATEKGCIVLVSYRRKCRTNEDGDGYGFYTACRSYG